MTKGVRAQRREIFIREMIRAESLEDQINAYLLAFPQCKSRDSARAASYRLLQEVDVRNAIEEEKRRIYEEKLNAEREERVRVAKLTIAHEFELDAALSKIALGTHRRKIRKPVYNRVTKTIQNVVIEEEPSETDMISAADKLYRRKGSYAPTTLKHEGGDTFIEFMKSISQLGNKNIPDVLQPGSDKKV